MPKIQPSRQESSGQPEANAAPGGAQPLANHKHEAYAQRVAAGKSGTAAYREVYGGTTKSAGDCAPRVSRRPEMAERVRFLKEQQARRCEMTRDEMVRILVETVRARPSDAGLDNPLCELRMGKDGPYAVFMDKARAAERLAKMLGWDEPEKVEHSGAVSAPALSPQRLLEIQARRRAAMEASPS